MPSRRAGGSSFINVYRVLSPGIPERNIFTAWLNRRRPWRRGARRHRDGSVIPVIFMSADDRRPHYPRRRKRAYYRRLALFRKTTERVVKSSGFQSTRNRHRSRLDVAIINISMSLLVGEHWREAAVWLIHFYVGISSYFDTWPGSSSVLSSKALLAAARRASSEIVTAEAAERHDVERKMKGPNIGGAPCRYVSCMYARRISSNRGKMWRKAGENIMFMPVLHYRGELPEINSMKRLLLGGDDAYAYRRVC